MAPWTPSTPTAPLSNAWTVTTTASTDYATGSDATAIITTYSHPIPTQSDKEVELERKLNRHREACHDAIELLRCVRQTTRGIRPDNTPEALQDEVKLFQDGDWQPTARFVATVLLKYYLSGGTLKKAIKRRELADAVWNQVLEQLAPDATLWESLRDE